MKTQTEFQLLDKQALEMITPRFELLTNKEMTKFLQGEGYTDQSGKPISEPSVSKFCNDNGLRRRKEFTKGNAKKRAEEEWQNFCWNLKIEKEEGATVGDLAIKYNAMGFTSKNGKKLTGKTIYNILDKQISKNRPKNFYRIEGKNPLLVVPPPPPTTQRLVPKNLLNQIDDEIKEEVKKSGMSKLAKMLILERLDNK
jgi:hypothetical protein